jgi:uncharacterized SAM-binding protein YcdF (DUF218 family)
MEILNKNQRDSAFWRLLALFSTVLVLLAIIAAALVRPFRQAPKKVTLLEQQLKALQTDKVVLTDKLKKSEDALKSATSAAKDAQKAVIDVAAQQNSEAARLAAEKARLELEAGRAEIERIRAATEQAKAAAKAATALPGSK